MDTYSIQRMVMGMDALAPGEKLLAMCLAHAVAPGTGKVRRTRSWMTKATGMSGGSLRRAIAGLVRHGVVLAKRTGRSTIYDFSGLLRGGVYIGGRVDGPHGDHQTGQGRTIGESESCSLAGVKLLPSGEPKELARFKDALASGTY